MKNQREQSLERCPCFSGKRYAMCCQKYHRGALPENALVLMRSRYCAYALGLAEYIIETTHPESHLIIPNRNQWLTQIRAFSTQTQFDGLDILKTQLSDSVSFVVFVAHLSKKSVDLTFTEKSRFLKVGEAWKYVDGKIAKGALKEEEIKDLC